MYTTHCKGEIACCEVTRRALEKGVIVSRPAIEARYDLVLDVKGKFYRAQVKYVDSRPSSRTEGTCNDAIQVDLRKQCRNNGKTKKYSKDEVDVILVYVPRIEKILWVGPELFDNRTSLNFRFTPPKKKQAEKKIMMIDKYIW